MTRSRLAPPAGRTRSHHPVQFSLFVAVDVVPGAMLCLKSDEVVALLPGSLVHESIYIFCFESPYSTFETYLQGLTVAGAAVGTSLS